MQLALCVDEKGSSVKIEVSKFDLNSTWPPRELLSRESSESVLADSFRKFVPSGFTAKAYLMPAAKSTPTGRPHPQLHTQRPTSPEPWLARSLGCLHHTLNTRRRQQATATYDTPSSSRFQLFSTASSDPTDAASYRIPHPSDCHLPTCCKAEELGRSTLASTPVLGVSRPVA